MAATYSIVKKGVTVTGRYSIVDVTLDTTYGAGGYALTAASMGVSTIVGAQVLGQNAAVLPTWDTTNNKLKIYKGASTVTVTSGNAAFTELATNDTLVSGSTVVRLLVWGDSPNG